jgi:flagellar biosynthesis protein FlhA
LQPLLASKVCFKGTGKTVDRSQLINTARNNVADLGRGNLGVPLLLLVMLAMMMLPMPPFLLDVFFTFNIALSIVVCWCACTRCGRWISRCSRPFCWWRRCCAWR